MRSQIFPWTCLLTVRFYLSISLPPSLPITAVFGNDTVVGDPLFSVPLTFTREGFENLPRGAKGIPHLCYEIHGQANSSFNLLSDACTSVNALYSAMETTEPVGFNVLTKIGISALNSINQCVFIEVGLENGCTPIIRSSDRDGDGILDPMEMIRFESHGVSVAKRRRHIRVSVPNCDGARRLVMYVMCDLNTSVPMIRFDVTRGINLSPTSHGLIGTYVLNHNYGRGTLQKRVNLSLCLHRPW